MTASNIGRKDALVLHLLVQALAHARVCSVGPDEDVRRVQVWRVTLWSLCSIETIFWPNVDLCGGDVGEQKLVEARSRYNKRVVSTTILYGARITVMLR